MFRYRLSNLVGIIRGSHSGSSAAEKRWFWLFILGVREGG